MMKLQVNNSGAWKHVATFEAKEEPSVRQAAANVGLAAHMAGGSIKWRLLDASEEVAVYWQADKGWFKPARAEARAAADAADAAAPVPALN